MSRRSNVLLPVVIAIAAWASILPMNALIAGHDHLIGAASAVGVLGVVGVLGALTKLGRGLTYTLQILAAVAFALWRSITLSPDVPFPSAVIELCRSGAAAINESKPPIEGGAGVVFLVLLLALLVQLIVELLATVLDQPSWTFAPLFLSYIVAAIANHDELTLGTFAAVAAAYVLVLVTATSVGDGYRAAGASRAGAFHATRAVFAAVLAVAAIASAVALQPLVPLGEKQPWQGSGSGPIRLSDPTVELNKNLLRPENRPVLTYRTQDGEPVYLRTVALPNLTSHGASLTQMKLRTKDLEGAYEAPGRDVTVDVQMDNVPSEYLPVPFAVDSFDARGSWAYDPATLSVVATGRDRTQETVGLGYSARAVAPNPSKEDLDDATAGTDADPITTAVPDVDKRVVELTKQVVGKATTDGQKAQAIQKFLRSDKFGYSIEAPQHASLDVISSFVLEDRNGYCIHFASAMMTMARIEGIPSRMAVGFNSGSRLNDGAFQVTSHNMHAWPELYFQGLGWVPFEPTPSVAEPPAYTDPDASPSATPSPSPSPSPSASPSAAPDPTPSSNASPEPTPTSAPTEEPAPQPGESSSSAWVAVLLGVLGVLVLLALPWLLRQGIYRWRLRAGQEPRAQADAAWREVHATFIDAGVPWPDGSPGPAARTAAASIPAGRLLAQVAETVERVAFSRDGADVTELPQQVAALRQSMLESLPWWRKFWPRSLWRWR